MCHDTRSRPPSFGAGTVAEHGAITLVSSDGTKLSALQAFPAEVRGANVVILPDVRGTHPYYAALADRFAAAGHAAVVIDYYGRTAGPGDRGSDFSWKPHFAQVDSANVAHDTAAAVAFLQAKSARPTFVVGFCFGGGQAWRLAASDIGLAGVVGFYGLPRLVHDVVSEIHIPMLLLLAGNDVATSAPEFAQLTDELTDAGVAFTEHTYAGAPHSFFDASYDQWQDACRDAWTATMAFIDHFSRDCESTM